MSTFGVVVEGDYDREALGELIRKVTEGDLDIYIRVCRSSNFLMRNFPAFLEDFRHVKRGSCVDKAIVVRDADNKNPQELIQKMEQRIQERSYPFSVFFVIIVQELEAWLLADQDAISTVTGRPVPRVNEPLEDIDDPKIKLKQILIGAGLSYTAKVAKQIAAGTSLERLDYRCPRFRILRQAVLDC